MSQYADFTTRATPQSERADERQELNHQGGYSFVIPALARAKRFLILGSDGPTFYQSARDLTVENARVIIDLAADPELGRELIQLIVRVSTEGLALRRQPAIFALALAAAKGHKDVRADALSTAVFHSVIRTGTDLFQFVAYSLQHRGVSRAWRRAVGSFYSMRTPDEAAYQMLKYRSREGRTHRDVMRLSHPKLVGAPANALAQWALNGVITDELPVQVRAFEIAKSSSVAQLCGLIEEYRLSWEMLPDAALSDPFVWAQLFDSGALPIGALLRQLPRLTNLGVVDGPFAGVAAYQRTEEIALRLTNEQAIRAARIHPLQALVAQVTYANGGGRTKIKPVERISHALDEMFYRSFHNAEGSGKRTLLAVDVSGSMSWHGSSPIEGLTAAQIAAAFAMLIQRTEERSLITGFSHHLVQLPLTQGMRLDQVMQVMGRVTMGATDCSLPMRQALASGWEVDTFVVITDNETRHGRQHPHEALADYRRKTGIPAKLVVMATTPTQFSIAQPDDPGMLDIVGFSPDVAKLITEFSRGW